MDYSEKWGDSIDEAVKLALDDLKLTEDQVEVIVLEQPSRGFFGIGSKLAKVRVEKKKTEKKAESKFESKLENTTEILDEKVSKIKDKVFNTFSDNSSVSEDKDPDKEKSDKSDIKSDNKLKNKLKFNSKSSNASEIKDNKDDKNSETGDKNSESNSSKEKKSEKRAKKDFRIEDLKIKKDSLEVLKEHSSIDFIKDLSEKMNLDLDIDAYKGDKLIYIEMNGKDAGTVIGKRGQTLDAIQYLTSLVVNKDTDEYTRVVIDAENYRSKREKTLEQLAHRLANKVIKNKKSVRLEPMNPYERKVIHATLQNNKYIKTRSEGDEPYRRVIVELKKDK